jgi:pimeloyl-ACP methyl ester carboxylesterase
MSYFKHGACQLHYTDHGQGEPVLLVHGLGSSVADWEMQLPALTAHYRVVAIDLRGHGRSDKPREAYSIEGFAADLLALLEHLGLDKVHLVGISMGGMIGLQFAVDHPERLHSLCIVNSSPEVKVQSLQIRMEIGKRWLFSRLLSMQQLGKVLGRRLFPRADQAELREKIETRWQQNDKRAYLSSLDAIIGWGVRERLSAISCPTLVVAADQDYTPVAQKQDWCAEIAGARLVVVEDSRHASPLDQPQRFNEILLDFLNPLTKEP